MPVRTYRPKRRTIRSRRTMLRRKMVTKTLNKVANSQVYPFRRFHYKLSQGGTDGVVQAATLTFSLNELPNANEFTVLFDQYKIAGIKYRWTLNRSPDYGGAVISNIYNTAVQGTFPRLMWVHDYDNLSGTPANFAELQQYSKCKTVYLTPDKPSTKWYFFKPARQAVEYESAVNSAYRPTWKGFIDCASDSTPHCGIRYICDGLASNIQLRLECYYYIVMKNVR